MLITRLNLEQRRVFLALAYRLALADHWVPEAEDQFMDKLIFDLGLNEKVNAMDVMGDAELDVLNTTPARAIVMLELMALAYSDETYHANESEVMAEIGGKLGFSDAEIEQFRDWGRRQADVGRRILALLPPHDD